MTKTFARFKEMHYLCIAFEKTTLEEAPSEDGKGSLGEWLKPPVC